jgi:TolB-like protein
MSPNSDNQYFADGIHEELLSHLAQTSSFEVVSRTSVMPFRETSLSIPEIAQQLNVDTVLEGSVRRAGGQVRITFQLINGVTDLHLWTETYEHELTMENLFSIQEEVARKVSTALQAEFVSQAAPVNLPTRSLEAYDLYLLGRYETFQQTRSGLDQAVIWLERALEIDKEFAEAWATLGWAYSFQGSGYSDKTPSEVYGAAREAALKALVLDPNLADAHSLHADILTWYDWDWLAAEEEYLAALKWDPSNVLGYVLFLSTQQRHDEAIELVEKLINRYPGSEFIHINAAWRYLNARRYDQALIQASLAPEHIDFGGVTGWALLSSGREEEALAVFEWDFERQPDNPLLMSNLAVAHARLGNNTQARELLRKLIEISALTYIQPDSVAAVLFELGDADSGFEWMQKALEQRSRGLIFLQVDHVYDRYRQDPRYLALEEALGFKLIRE